MLESRTRGQSERAFGTVGSEILYNVVCLNLSDLRQYSRLLTLPEIWGKEKWRKKKEDDDEEDAGGRRGCSERHYIY